jgi:hypothetical protein
LVTEAESKAIQFEEKNVQNAKECRWPVEADKSKIINSVLSASKMQLFQDYVITPVTLFSNF